MSETYVVRIDPDGTVTRLDGDDMHGLAIEGLRPIGGYHGSTPWGQRIDEDEPSVDIVACQDNGVAPFPEGYGYLVAAVHQWGRMIELPVNPKAWSLYGRSPLVGPAFVALDMSRVGSPSRPALPDEWLNAIEGEASWITEPIMARMRQVADEEGCRWL